MRKIIWPLIIIFIFTGPIFYRNIFSVICIVIAVLVVLLAVFKNIMPYNEPNKPKSKS